MCHRSEFLRLLRACLKYINSLFVAASLPHPSDLSMYQSSHLMNLNLAWGHLVGAHRTALSPIGAAIPTAVWALNRESISYLGISYKHLNGVSGEDSVLGALVESVKIKAVERAGEDDTDMGAEEGALRERREPLERSQEEEVPQSTECAVALVHDSREHEVGGKGQLVAFESTALEYFSSRSYKGLLAEIRPPQQGDLNTSIAVGLSGIPRDYVRASVSGDSVASQVNCGFQIT